MLKKLLLVGIVGVYALPCYAQTRALADAEKKIISEQYGTRLKDPFSAQYKWPQVPVKDIKNGQVGYCFQINAKNSYGGYTGYRLILGTLRRVNGKVVGFDYVMGANDDTVAAQQDTANLCKAFGLKM